MGGNKKIWHQKSRFLSFLIIFLKYIIFLPKNCYIFPSSANKALKIFCVLCINIPNFLVKEGRDWKCNFKRPSCLHAEMTMPDLQQYPWNLNLTINVKDSVVFLTQKYLILWVSPLASSQGEMHKSVFRETANENKQFKGTKTFVNRTLLYLIKLGHLKLRLQSRKRGRVSRVVLFNSFYLTFRR